MRKIKHMPAERAYPKGIPKTSVPSGQSYWMNTPLRDGQLNRPHQTP